MDTPAADFIDKFCDATRLLRLPKLSLRPLYTITESLFLRYVSMAGIKRSINGQVKPQNQVQQPEDVAMTDAIPPCGQPQPPSIKTTSSDNPAKTRKNPSNPEPPTKKHSPTSAPPKQPSNSRSTNPKPRQKLAKLPKSTLQPLSEPKK